MAELKYLHPDEWLHEAKKVPIGQARRTFHGAESRPNLVVRNERGAWSAYCHKCHKGGRVQKELVKIVQAQELPKQRLCGNPGPLVDIRTAMMVGAYGGNTGIPWGTLEQIVRHWQEKGVGWPEVAWANPHWSSQDKRIVYMLPGGMLGRDLTGSHPAKWYSYQRDMFWAPGGNLGLAGNTLVLTEDWYSAAKITHYTDAVGIACLGTVICPELLVELQQARDIVLCFDGDFAGHAATERASKTLGLLGYNFRVALVPVGKDPKDLTGEQLCQLLKV